MAPILVRTYASRSDLFRAMVGHPVLVTGHSSIVAMSWVLQVYFNICLRNFNMNTCVFLFGIYRNIYVIIIQFFTVARISLEDLPTVQDESSGGWTAGNALWVDSLLLWLGPVTSVTAGFLWVSVGFWSVSCVIWCDLYCWGGFYQGFTMFWLLRVQKIRSWIFLVSGRYPAEPPRVHYLPQFVRGPSCWRCVNAGRHWKNWIAWFECPSSVWSHQNSEASTGSVRLPLEASSSERLNPNLYCDGKAAMWQQNRKSWWKHQLPKAQTIVELIDTHRTHAGWNDKKDKNKK